jgi:hypothetical protein
MLNQRLEIQKDYYKQQDEMRGDYNAGLYLGLLNKQLLQWICIPPCNRLVRKHLAA